jgi:hypothetical protein
MLGLQMCFVLLLGFSTLLRFVVASVGFLIVYISYFRRQSILTRC